MNSIKLTADIDELYKLNEFVNEIIPKNDFQVDLIVEEVFVNIVEYSKSDYVNVNAEYENQTLILEFIDGGIEFNPLSKDDPKAPESIGEAQVGGLGIFLTKQMADEITYDYFNGENHLKIFKQVQS